MRRSLMILVTLILVGCGASHAARPPPRGGPYGVPPGALFDVLVSQARGGGWEVRELDPMRGYFSVRARSVQPGLRPTARWGGRAYQVSLGASLGVQVYADGSFTITPQGDVSAGRSGGRLIVEMDDLRVMFDGAGRRMGGAPGRPSAAPPP